MPKQPQHAPHMWVAPNYGTKVQYTPLDNTSIPLYKHGIKQLQDVIGTLLFMGRAMIELIILSLLPSAPSWQLHKQKEPKAQRMHSSNYWIMQQLIRMQLSITIEVTWYCTSTVMPPTLAMWSCLGGCFYLGHTIKPLDNQKPNGPLHIESRILHKIMAAVLEAEISVLFHNGQETIHFQQILYKIRRLQNQPTSITTDNSTDDGFANKHTKLKWSKAIDMRFY